MSKPQHEACISYRRDSNVCADGFIQKGFCRGYGGCIDCGHISEAAMPYCLRDELPKHFVTESGAPLFYQEKANG